MESPDGVLDIIKAAYETTEDIVGKQGYKTAGHLCVIEEDVQAALKSGSNLQYGELLPPGMEKMLDPAHLDAAHAASLIELGMGTGKVAIQAFLQFPCLLSVIGIELARSRYLIGRQALQRLAEICPLQFSFVDDGPDMCRIHTKIQDPSRRLEFRAGDMLALPRQDISTADILIMETCVPPNIHLSICQEASLNMPVIKAVLLSDLTLTLLWLVHQTQPYPSPCHWLILT